MSTKPKLIIRKARLKDSHAIAALSERVYGHAGSMTEEQIRAQINKFPDGQLVAEYEGEIAGHCATFIISESVALKPHSWFEITGNGYASRHDPDGDVLYGMEVCVDAKFRRLRIGQRFYRVRRELCEHFELKGIAFGGRMPGYARRRREFPDPKDYLEAVQNKRVRDTVINFQMAQGYERCAC